MSEDTKTAPSPLDITRNGTYSFPENGKPSPNYVRRVKPSGGNFVQGVNEVVAIEPGDILMKLPGKNPWFAQFRDGVEETETPATEGTEPTGEESAPAEGEAKAEGETEAKAEGETEAKAEGEPEPKAEGETEAKTEGETEPKAEGETKAEAPKPPGRRNQPNR
jgi:hypothetical protein